MKSRRFEIRLKPFDIAGLETTLDAWMPHELAWTKHFRRNLGWNVTKSTHFWSENTSRKRLWSDCGDVIQTIEQPGLTVKKVLLCVWRDCKGITMSCFHLANSGIYCQKLTRLKQAIDKKRPKLANRKNVVFNQGNVSSQTSLTTPQKLRELE